jgi:UDP-glucose 4-epimerase
MAVLVTGGAGFVGAYVVRDLLAQGKEVVVYDAAVSSNTLDMVLRDADARDDVRLVQGRVTDGWRMLRACREHRVDSIVHLASPLTQDVAANPPVGIEDVCSGTATIFETASAAGIERVVWASSIAVFGPVSSYGPDPIADDAAHEPESLYGSCKSLCERMAATYHQQDGTLSAGLRLTVVYGPGRLRGYMTFPSEFIRQVALGEPAELPFGDQLVNWQYVEDVAVMFTAALDAPLTGAVAMNTFGEARTFRAAADALQRLVPDARIAVRPGTFADDAGRSDTPTLYDDRVLRGLLGFEPRFPFERGIEATYRGYRRFAENR